MPLPAPADPFSPSNGDLPPGGSSGVTAGLDASLLALLRNYRPGDIGICEISDKLQLTLPLPEWSSYCWTVTGNITVAAGASVTQNLYTMPANTRGWVDGMRLRLNSGDNTLASLRILQPEGYGEGSREAYLIALTTPVAHIWWPDPGGRQVVDYGIFAWPQMIEPGGTIEVIPNGAGVSASNVLFEIVMRQTKLVRELAP